MDDQYRIDWSEPLARWVVRHDERGYVGEVEAIGGRFRAQAVSGDTVVPVAYGMSIKSMAEQVIWYDRAMNQEAE